jgi:predicted nucleic acid-binding protein
LIVADTSVVVKWAIDEDSCGAARDLIGQAVLAPDLILVELGHVLTKKVRRRELEATDARIAYMQLPLLLEVTSSRPYERRAFELALQLQHAIADCYFLALAETANMPLVTADQVFLKKVRTRFPAFTATGLGENPQV